MRKSRLIWQLASDTVPRRFQLQRLGPLPLLRAVPATASGRSALHQRNLRRRPRQALAEVMGPSRLPHLHHSPEARSLRLRCRLPATGMPQNLSHFRLSNPHLVPSSHQGERKILCRHAKCQRCPARDPLARSLLEGSARPSPPRRKPPASAARSLHRSPLLSLLNPQRLPANRLLLQRRRRAPRTPSLRCRLRPAAAAVTAPVQHQLLRFSLKAPGPQPL
jgi:hypothetical protein